MKKTLILILCLFLCTVSFARKRVKVACVGNSITYGIGVSDQQRRGLGTNHGNIGFTEKERIKRYYYIEKKNIHI